uniref:Uncharacterized protein n=1 Tax=Meloidogyne hapla TaxID=6305 RepID=A0A1I8BW01_MELHA
MNKLQIDECDSIIKELKISISKRYNFYNFYRSIKGRENLLNKIQVIITSMLMEDEENQKYIFEFPKSIIYHNEHTVKLHVMIYDYLLGKCSAYKDLSRNIHSTRMLIRESQVYQHTTAGQGVVLGQTQESNWENQQGSGYHSGYQQNIGQKSDYGNQPFLGYQPGFGDYSGTGHQYGYGHGSYSMGQSGGDMGSQGGSGYHGEQDTDIKEEGEFSD